MPDDRAYTQINVEGTRNVMEAALEAGVSKVVHVSTAAVWGKVDAAAWPISEETPVGAQRASQYAESKYEGDRIAWRLHQERGLPLVMIYPAAVVGPDDLASLEMHATVLRNNRERSVVIEGHCDERGTREYNLALGERRADAIRSYLTSAGVSPRQIETVSYGEERPEDPGQGEAAYARNRRAVMIYR